MFLKSKNKGFSLVELIVVIAILVVFAAILIPSLIQYTENSRAQKDESAMDEVVNAVQLALADQNCFDEMLQYSCTNNYITYSDSTGDYASQVIDGEFWAPDGAGRATTITFNPEVGSNNATIYHMDSAIINDMTYGNGSVAHGRVMEGALIENNQCYLKNASLNGNQTGYMYNRVRQTIGDTVTSTSQTYRNSSFTIFIRFTQKDGVTVADVGGQFNGTNLYEGAPAAIGSGTTEYEQETGAPIVSVTTPGKQESNYVSSDLIGGAQFSGTTEYKKEEDKGTICAALYNSNVLVFQATSVANPKYGTITKIYQGENGWLDTQYRAYDEVPWYNERLNINKVIVDCNISPISTTYWFREFKNCTTMDLNKLNTSLCKTMMSMFYECNALETVTISHFDTSKVLRFDFMFMNCYKLKNIDMSRWNTSSATNMQFMFFGCKEAEIINVSNFTTNNVTSMSAMFCDCYSVKELDVSGFNTSKITSLAQMFQGCKSLVQLDVSNFDTSNVTNMRLTFQSCNSLSSIDVSNFNTSKVTTMELMFYGCHSLQEIDVSSFDTSKVTNFGKMFSYCKSLKKIDGLTSFNTSSGTEFGEMFSICTLLEYLDLSSFDTRQVVDVEGTNDANWPASSHGMGQMFGWMKSLKKIKLGENFRFDGNGTVTYVAILPNISPDYVSGALGNGMWYNLETGQAYKYNQIPNGAGTYVSIPPQ